MASKLTVPNLAFTNIAMPDAPKIRVASNSLKGSGAVTLDNPILMTEGGVKPSLEMLLTFKNTEGKYILCSVPATTGFTSSTVIAGMLRGVELSGIDLATENSDLDIDLLEGSEVVGAIPAQMFQLVFDALRAQIGCSIKFATATTFRDTGIIANRVFADATARDAAITSPSNGMICYQTDTGVMMQYIGGAWATFATGTVANASETVAGKVELATAAERAAGTATGATGAKLVPTNDALVKASSGAGDENKIPILDASGKIASGFITDIYSNDSTLTAKGSMFAASAASTPDELAIGSLNQNLLVDSDETTGLRYGYPHQLVISSDWEKTETGSGSQTYQGLIATFVTGTSTNDRVNITTLIPAFDTINQSNGNISHYTNGDILDFTLRMNLSELTSQNVAIGFYGSADLVENIAGTGSKAMFKITNNTLESSTSDASTEEDQEISGISLSTWNTYRIRIDLGNSVKFYVNGVLKNTHSTNIPDDADYSFMNIGAGIKTTTTAARTMRLETICQLRLPRSA